MKEPASRRLLRRPAHRRRPDRPPDGRPGPEGQFISGDGIVSDEFASIAGPAAEGTLNDLRSRSAQRTRAPRTSSRSSATPASSRKPTRSTPTPPCRSSPQAIDQGRQSLDPQKVAETIKSGGPCPDRASASIGYDAKGDRTTPRLRHVRLEEGRRRQDHFCICALLTALMAGGMAALAASIALRTGSLSLLQNLFPIVFVLLFTAPAFFPRDLLRRHDARRSPQYNPLTYVVEGDPRGAARRRGARRPAARAARGARRPGRRDRARGAGRCAQGCGTR